MSSGSAAPLFGRNSALAPGHSALLVVDMQLYCAAPGRGLHAHVDPNNVPDKLQYFFKRLSSTTVPAIQTLLGAFRLQQAAKKANVVHTYIECLTKDGRDNSLDYKLSGFCVPKGDPDAAVLPALAPADDDLVIPKTSCSVFNSTNIDYVLRNLGVTQLVITGILSNQCIESAVRDAADKGYYVHVAEDAIATKNPQDHAHALKNMAGFARICSSDVIIAELATWE